MPATQETRGEDRVFGALSSPVRREVLRLLRDEGPQPVQQLAAHFDMRRPSLSEHLKVLREAGLVSEERAGRRRIYRLEAEPLTEVRDWLGPYERFWRAKLAGLAELLDDLPEAEGGDRTERADDSGAGT
ncbi:ArsR/SmtB family transcription factor [Streptomyces sp. CMB-StM0423]|uniref:ArsR/SmtB family transcription factor n=1 Tax=Streptomyces sp. CMB-StM0423 TaxID=2059884 RepID=UPI000C70ACD4|nr:metalloregulator ArsR/SmtB family transcription factor [Streptomyces sp. CMB-StM0423]AUH41195.1 transcriptional regulator [Streptomyces sp. CMB-StM0423]